MSTPVKSGPRFALPAGTFTDGRDSVLAALAGGGFVAGWTDGSLSKLNNNVFLGVDTVLQRFDADGSKLGSSFVAGTSSLLDQRDPAVTGLTNGGFVAVWTDVFFGVAGDDSGRSVEAQIYSSTGERVGAQFIVNTTTMVDQSLPEVTTLSSGHFVVTWRDDSGIDGSGTAIMAQVFSDDGTRVGSETLVNSSAIGLQTDSAIIALNDGGFVVTWTDGGEVSSGSGAAIRGQVFAADGSQTGGEFLVSVQADKDQFASDVTALADGGFVVSWADGDYAVPTPNVTIQAQIFEANGAVRVGAFLASTGDLQSVQQVDPAVAALDDGRFVVVWTDLLAPGSGYLTGAIRAQVFEADGAPSGEQFLVSGGLIGQSKADITVLADGRFVVSWTNEQAGVLGWGQIFDPREGAVSLAGGVLDDSFVGTRWNDRLEGLAGDDKLWGAVGRDTLVGGAGNDALFGGVGGDVLLGGNGHDMLSGDAGNDILVGGLGRDTLIGGDGADVFRFLSPAMAGIGGGRDQITDFVGGVDRIDLSGMDADLSTPGENDAFDFIGNAMFDHVAGQLRYTPSNGILWGDVDGDGVADFQVQLIGQPILLSTDLML